MSASPASIDPPDWSPTRIRVGPWTITALMDAWFRLDGGAMWGVVPKNLWQRMTPPAADNSILLAARPFLAQRDGLTVLIEGGMGERWSDKLRGIYHIDQTHSLARTLAQVGVELDEIDHVVASHCHFDHIGGLVVERDGGLAPLLPRAEHHFPAAELAASRVKAHPRRASYRAEDLEPIVEFARLELHGASGPRSGSGLHSGDAVIDLLPGLSLVPVGGHSDGLMVVRLDSEGQGPSAVFWGDLIPTTHHIQPPYIMAYDVDVARSYAMRTEWLARWVDEELIGLSYHDADMPFSTLTRDGKRYVAAPYPSQSATR